MMFTIRGIPTAGIAVGTAFVLQRRASAAATAAAGDPVAEAGRFHAALERAKAELSALAEGEAVFAAHLEMAGDPMLAGLVEGRIAEKHLSAGQALGEACEEVCGMFAALDDDYLRGRTDDVRDVCARIRRVLSGENLFTHSPMFKHTDMFDPEVITSGDSDFAASTTSGLNGTGNGYSYPMLKTVTLGINVTF